MSTDLVRCLPKSFIVNYVDDIDSIICKLPDHLRNDKDVIKNMKCTDHFFCLSNNFNPKRKDCYFCKNKLDLQ